MILISDECYSELYYDEEKPPVGLLEAAQSYGNTDFKNCLVFHSLSKRSNLPGLRSGFVAGDADLIVQFKTLSHLPRLCDAAAPSVRKYCGVV